jgi:hypothetical protein
MTLSWREQQVIRDIEEGLGVALSEMGYSRSDLTSIKVNKLVYIALREFYEDTPVTYSWFKYGPSVGHRHVSPESVPLQSIEEVSGREPRVGTREEFRTPEEYAYLFLEDIDYTEDILQDTTKSYLKPFYKEYASQEYSEFKRLYVKSAELQVRLDKIRSDGVSAYSDLYREIDDPLTGVGSEILSLSITDEAVDPFSQYAELLRDVILTVETECDELTAIQAQLLEQLITFYYSHSWRYPTLLLSEQTAIGPSRRDLTKATISDIETMARKYSSDFTELKNRIEDKGLLSESFTYDPEWEKNLIEGYQQLDEESEKMAEEWREASAEASDRL